MASHRLSLALGASIISVGGPLLYEWHSWSGVVLALFAYALLLLVPLSLAASHHPSLVARLATFNARFTSVIGRWKYFLALFLFSFAASLSWAVMGDRRLASIFLFISGLAVLLWNYETSSKKREPVWKVLLVVVVSTALVLASWSYLSILGFLG